MLLYKNTAAATTTTFVFSIIANFSVLQQVDKIKIK